MAVRRSAVESSAAPVPSGHIAASSAGAISPAFAALPPDAALAAASLADTVSASVAGVPSDADFQALRVKYLDVADQIASATPCELAELERRKNEYNFFLPGEGTVQERLVRNLRKFAAGCVRFDQWQEICSDPRNAHNDIDGRAHVLYGRWTSS